MSHNLWSIDQDKKKKIVISEICQKTQKKEGYFWMLSLWIWISRIFLDGIELQLHLCSNINMLMVGAYLQINFVSLGLSYESLVNRLGGVVLSVSIGRPNRPSSLLHVPSLGLPCLVRVCSLHLYTMCNAVLVTHPVRFLVFWCLFYFWFFPSWWFFLLVQFP